VRREYGRRLYDLERTEGQDANCWRCNGCIELKINVALTNLRFDKSEFYVG